MEERKETMGGVSPVVGYEGQAPEVKTYRPLPLIVRKKGWDMEQLKRGARAAIYSGSQDGAVLRWEVFMIKHHEGREIRGVKIEPAEYFPGDESFGAWSWAYGPSTGGLVAAERRFAELEAGKAVEEVEIENEDDDAVE
jgi:hypothetical protein